jgi:hypothetical protein
MNRLSTDKRAQIIGCLVEGNSIRATVRITGAAKNTVTKLLTDLGGACAIYQNQVLRDLPCKTVECDEMWGFCYSKQKNVPTEYQGTFGYGDVWTWIAICADTTEDCMIFLRDLKSRMSNRIQLSTDGHQTYMASIPYIFDEVDWAQIHKIYKAQNISPGRYSPPVCTGTKVKVRLGDPDPAKVSTSYVERQNLTMRMGMRRFTRLTNGFSKKVENLAHAVSLHYMHYNFGRIHQTLGVTPAVAAGVADHKWSLKEIAALLD